jgi:hypothetical protein
MKMQDHEMIELFKAPKFVFKTSWKSNGSVCCTACHNPLEIGGRGRLEGCEGYDESGNAIYLCEYCLEEPERIDGELERHAISLANKAAWLRSLKGRIKAPSYANYMAATKAYYDAEKAADSKLWLNCIASDAAVDLTEPEVIRLVNQFKKGERGKISFSDIVMPNGKKLGDCASDYLRAVAETVQKIGYAMIGSPADETTQAVGRSIARYARSKNYERFVAEVKRSVENGDSDYAISGWSSDMTVYFSPFPQAEAA